MISKSGISISPEKLNKIQSFPIPQNKSKVRSFLGLIGQYKSYVNNFENLTKPLRKLTDPNTGFNWGQKEDDAFYALKHQMINSQPKPLQPYY